MNKYEIKVVFKRSERGVNTEVLRNKKIFMTVTTEKLSWKPKK